MIDDDTALLVAAGGALGTAARFLLTSALARVLREQFPWSTLTVNVSGSLLLGCLVAFAAGSEALSPFLGAGLLGGYTTVSSFALQTVVLQQQRSARAAATYLLISAFGSLAAAALGYVLGSALHG